VLKCDHFVLQENFVMESSMLRLRTEVQSNCF
jgi:hypothetical protein